MEKVYHLEGHLLRVVFEPKIIRIKDSEALINFLSIAIAERSKVLVDLIKVDYLNFIGRPLLITDDSITVEIWCHIYAGLIAQKVKKFIPLQIVAKASDFVIHRSHIIDCGEKGVDSNRRIWDALSYFKKGILLLIK